ncbi:MAG: hypothetical protein ABI681_09525, partial [Gemmatimonadales bacterium]
MSMRVVGVKPLAAFLAVLAATGCTNRTAATKTDTDTTAVAASTATGAEAAADDLSAATLASGQQIFRFDTFGDEQFWTDTLHMERVVQKNVDPTTALSVGLKVDMDALPPEVVKGVKE